MHSLLTNASKLTRNTFGVLPELASKALTEIDCRKEGAVVLTMPENLHQALNNADLKSEVTILWRNASKNW